MTYIVVNTSCGCGGDCGKHHWVVLSPTFDTPQQANQWAELQPDKCPGYLSRHMWKIIDNETFISYQRL